MKMVEDEADRARRAAEYRRKWLAGEIGPGLVERERKQTVTLPALTVVEQVNWGKDAKGRRVWVGPTDADGHPLTDGA